MNEQMVDGPFKSAAAKVEEAHEKAVAELKSSVENAKAAALKKVSS